MYYLTFLSHIAIIYVMEINYGALECERAEV